MTKHFLAVLLSVCGCAKAPVLTLENTHEPGANRLEGSIIFPVELKAGARVQLAYSSHRKGSVPDLEGANGMKALDLPAAAKKLDFVVTGLPDGDITLFARAYGSETMAKMKAQLLEAQETFKKTGKSTMAPNPPYDFAGFYTGDATASVEGKAAKVLSLSKGAPQTGLVVALAVIDNAEPPPFAGTLTMKAVLAMKNSARPFADFDETYARFEKALGKPTVNTDTHFAWAVVEGERCAYVFFDKDERKKFFKDQTGFMVGASMPATEAARDDAECLKALAPAP